MELLRILKGLCLIALLFCHIQSLQGQVALQADYKTAFDFKNVLKGSDFSKNVSSIPSSVNFNDPSLPWRLPQVIRPYHYDLLLIPVLEAGHEAIGQQWTTPGTVKISVTALANTTNITLHTRDLIMRDLAVGRPIN